MPRYRRVFDHDEIFLLKFNEFIVGFSAELLKTAERNFLFEQCDKLVEVFIDIITEMLDICCAIISTWIHEIRHRNQGIIVTENRPLVQ